MSKLLINEPPLQLLPSLAVEIGLNESLVIQQIHYWIQKNGKMINGKPWTYNSYRNWQKQFPFWSESSVKRVFQSLEEKGLLISGNYNKLPMDKTKWYAINYERLDEIEQRIDENVQALCQLDPTIVSTCTDEEVNLTRPITETTTETNPDIYIEDFFKTVWGLYPNKHGVGKVGKKKKVELYKVGIEKITNCINLYVKHVEAQRKAGFDLQYQYGSTFFNSGYKDYLSGPSTPKREPVKLTIIETDYLNQ
jgi:hypothetical protein